MPTTDIPHASTILIADKPVNYMPDMSDDKVASFAHFDHVEGEGKGYAEAHIDPALDERITRKFDRRIVPWLFGLWLLAFIDRSNIGNFSTTSLVYKYQC